MGSKLFSSIGFSVQSVAALAHRSPPLLWCSMSRSEPLLLCYGKAVADKM
jgi:hypothetical protein